MTSVEEAASGGPSNGGDWPAIPRAAWSRGIGVPCPEAGHPRVPHPILDEGEFHGVPLGGLGTGSIGRTYRGDAARWHLEVGRHRHEPVAADGFSLFVAGPEGPRRAVVLSALRPGAAELPAWGWDLPVGGGTYHALFPRAWQTFEPEATGGVRIIAEQLSPVIGGDLERSALPCGVLEWWLENPGPDQLTVGLLFTWADPPGASGAAPARPHRVIRSAAGVALELGDPGDGAPTGLRGTFAIAAAAGDGIALSARAAFDPIADEALWTDFAADGRLDPGPAEEPAGTDAAGAAIAATVELAPGERRSIRFSMAWDLPTVEFGSGRRWWKRYTRAWGRSGERAVELAWHAIADAAAWRRAIEAWQAPYLEDPERPDWYVMALFNELYFLVDGGTFWEAGEVGGAEPKPEDPGRFALLECVDYPFYDTVDVDFYASWALLELFPALELRGIRDLLAAIPVDDPDVVTIEASGARARRKLGGTVPHDIGGPDEDPFVRPNRYHFQDVNGWKDLGPKFVLQAWRDAAAAGKEDGDGLIRAAWPTVLDVMTRLQRADRDGDGLPEHDGLPDQTYDTWPMRGPSAYGGSLWLAAVAATEAMAGRLGLDEAARTWGATFERAQIAFDRRLWRQDHYAYDDGGGPSSDSVMADQLAGQWYADATGLGDLLPADRVDAALRTVHRLNVCSHAGGAMGPVNGMRPDGTVDDSSEQSAEVWAGTAYALAAFMIGRGLVDEGWDTARGVVRTTYERGLWFRTPEAYDADGNFRATIYLRPLAIWAIEDSLRRRRALQG
ncbi:MAG TPA: non-lysosomal glucosylceramidase [Candidatus Limnocylindrales bacterium]|nr:non-lysosomal glucosylceramidase [Candidatus Limnocylindrales bacterium]